MQQQDVAVQYVELDALIPYAMNSRTHSDAQVAQIAASIREFGWTNPVLVDEHKGIIAGHGRVLAARKLGITKVPCIELAHMTEAQKRAYVIADNKLALNAGWDDEVLALELQALQGEGFDIDLTGFDDAELAALLEKARAEPEMQADPDDAPDVRAVAVTKPGDVWLLGKHRLMCGDSTSIEALQELCQGQLVDMWLTDPPYNVAYEGKTKDALKIKNDAMGDDQFRTFLRDAYTAADAVMKPERCSTSGTPIQRATTSAARLVM